VATPGTPPDDLVRAIASVEDALTQEFPGVAAATIHDYGSRSFDAMTPAKVTTFLPILVARDARTHPQADTAA
jgi:hypothetical protein